MQKWEVWRVRCVGGCSGMIYECTRGSVDSRHQRKKRLIFAPGTVSGELVTCTFKAFFTCGHNREIVIRCESGREIAGSNDVVMVSRPSN